MMWNLQTSFLFCCVIEKVTQSGQSSFGTSQQLVTNSEKETTPKVEKPSEAEVGGNVERKEIKSADANNTAQEVHVLLKLKSHHTT